jgi:alanyl-tRNA synthetase
MHSSKIRQTFIDFFVEKGHLHYPSSSLVPPAGDTTVLFTTAGMQQMTPFFLGLQKPPHNRLTTVQKSFRTVDIDEVGDLSHNTFFEMLGNFSVGDYFKEGAVDFAWEFLVNRLGLEESKLYPSIYPTDEEAFALWNKKIGVPENRIIRLEDNWWGPVGETGPCGPDSEIYYDLGPEFDPDPNAKVGDSYRYLEIWNLVFMQFNRGADKKDVPLPSQNIDTGMGLERLSLVLQGKSTIHETDLFFPIIQKAAEISGRRYGDDPKADFSMRVIGDHSRASAFLIADGVRPGAEDRSYILRRILRRAIRHGRLLGLETLFMRHTVQVVMDMMGQVYPELIERKTHILNIIEKEEEAFGRTLQTGLNRFDILVGQNPLNQTIKGEEAFQLSSTFGFPIDLTRELAEERGFTIDMDEYHKAEEKHRQASRSLERFKTNRPDLEDYKALGVNDTPFKGYLSTNLETSVIAVFVNGKKVESAESGQDAEIVLQETPFYVESGGQVSDTGYIQTEGGNFIVENTYKPVGNMTVHQGRITEGFISIGEQAKAVVEENSRLDIARNHTGTHILHQALKDVLGDEVGQAGSLVAPDRLRFDFTFSKQISPAQLRQIENIVNAKVRDDMPVEVIEASMDEAKQAGAVMMFGEKYGDRVRMLKVGDYSLELCGGTHLNRSGQIGMMVITGEGSVASGVRRVEAITGRFAEKYVQARLQLVDLAASVLQTRPEALAEEAAELRRKLKETERELANLRQKQALGGSESLLSQVQEVNGVRILAVKVDAANIDIMRSIGDKLRDTMKSGVVALGTVIAEKPSLLVMVTPDLVDKGFKAGSIISPMAEVIGGRAGGRPNMAQGGGTDPTKLDDALALTKEIVAKQSVN